MIDAGLLKERLLLQRPQGGTDGMDAPAWVDVGTLWGQCTRTAVASGDEYAMEEYWHETATVRVRSLYAPRVGWRIIWNDEPWQVRGVEDRHDGSTLLTLRRENE